MGLVPTIVGDFLYSSADVVVSTYPMPIIPVAWYPYLFFEKFLFPTSMRFSVVGTSMVMMRVVEVMHFIMIMVAILDKWLPEFLPSKCLCCGCNS